MNKDRGHRHYSQHGGHHGGHHGSQHYGPPQPQRPVQPQQPQQPAYPPVNPRVAAGRTLTRVLELADAKPTDVALDLASGPSYLAVGLAPKVATVACTDVTSFTTEENRRLALSKGLANIHVFGCESEALPFRDGTFTLVVSRVAGHHFADVRRSMHEISRVLAKGGRVVIADTVVPSEEEIDRFVNHLDHLHDPTHVRNYSLREWKVLFADAGLKLKFQEEDICEDDRGECLREWLGRTGANAQTIRLATGLLVSAKHKIKEALAIRADRGEMFFQIKRAILAGEK